MFLFFFFNDTATTEIYTLSPHDALPIFFLGGRKSSLLRIQHHDRLLVPQHFDEQPLRSEEHTSELQSQSNLVCRLLLEKKTLSPTYLHLHSSPLTFVGDVLHVLSLSLHT